MRWNERLSVSLSRHHDPIAAIATAPGRGALGIVRISGFGLEALARAVCARQLKPREARYTAFVDDKGEPIDHGLGIFFPAPNSFTGEDVLELQAHGGPVVLQLLLTRCLQAAAEIVAGQPRLARLRLAQPGEFSERAFLNDKIDLAQAEAIADLIDANTEAAARSATRSLSCVFSADIQGLFDALVKLRMLVEASLDFPEEDIEILTAEDAARQLMQLHQGTEAVLSKARQGALLREGIKVVIAGQPNAGKSSLLNALAGAELAIVTPHPGTTRDKIQQTIQIEGVPVHVIDTAGLRESIDEVEKIGIAHAWEAMASADAVLLLHDLTQSEAAQYAADDAAIAMLLATKKAADTPIIDVWNKVDLQPESGPGECLRVSAKTGAGLDALRGRLLAVAGWRGTAEGVYAARERHLQALRRFAQHLTRARNHLQASQRALELAAEELRLAQSQLGEITGMFTPNDLLGAIFAGFCVGK